MLLYKEPAILEWHYSNKLSSAFTMPRTLQSSELICVSILRALLVSLEEFFPHFLQCHFADDKFPWLLYVWNQLYFLPSCLKNAVVGLECRIASIPLGHRCSVGVSRLASGAGEIFCRPYLCSSVHNVPFSSGLYSTFSLLVLTNLLMVRIDLSLHFLSLLQWASGICRLIVFAEIGKLGAIISQNDFHVSTSPSIFAASNYTFWHLIFFPHG